RGRGRGSPRRRARRSRTALLATHAPVPGTSVPGTDCSQNAYCTVPSATRSVVLETRGEVRMTGHEHEAERQHLLLIVERAQREGKSEDRIARLVEEALAEDATLDEAA